MKSLIGKRVRVIWTKSPTSMQLEGIVAKVDEHMVFLTEVKDTIEKYRQPDQWINTHCGGFQKFVILEEKTSLKI